MAKLNDDVLYFPDYGSAYPVPMAAKVIMKSGDNVSLYIYPHESSGSEQILDASTGYVPEGVTLQECLNPGNKWISREQAVLWGVI